MPFTEKQPGQLLLPGFEPVVAGLDVPVPYTVPTPVSGEPAARNVSTAFQELGGGEAAGHLMVDPPRTSKPPRTARPSGHVRDTQPHDWHTDPYAKSSPEDVPTPEQRIAGKLVFAELKKERAQARYAGWVATGGEAWAKAQQRTADERTK